MLIRDETAGDIPAIGRLVTEALLMLAQSTGTEAGDSIIAYALPK